MFLESSGCFRPLGSRSVVRELVLDLSPQWNCWQQLYWNSWSLSSTDHQGTFAFSFTLLALKWLLCFTCSWRGVGGVSSVRGCCSSQVSSAASALCPHIFAFQYLDWVCMENCFIFLLRVDGISSKAPLVLWLWLPLKMKVGVFFSLGRWVMYLIQLNKSHDYCN